MRKVWWVCRDCGHAWEAAVANRAAGTGCPACWQARRGVIARAVPFERSLAHLAPALVVELRWGRNVGVDPTRLGARSSQKLWWACGTCGHEWQARVADRTAGTGCPACAPTRAHGRAVM